MFEQKKMAAVDSRKREKEQKEYAKQVQAERIKEKHAARKTMMDSVKRIRKQKDRCVPKGLCVCVCTCVTHPCVSAAPFAAAVALA